MRELEFIIDRQNGGLQIRDYLKNFGVSSSLLAKLKRTENGITKNGQFAKTIENINAGDILKIKIENKGTMPAPVKMNVEIIFEDEDIIVFNKPPLMPVHESRNHIGDTLSNFASYHMKENTAFRAVYRLDRDTSGLVLAAKHELAASKLAGKIKKDYYAVVQGTISSTGTIDAPIARCGDSIIKRKVDECGENAVTHYVSISTNNNSTLLKINLETGRTHQIRVHFSHIGHPLLGDTLYGGSADKIPRQALHCRDIYFIHPITMKNMHLTADFPSDILSII